MIAVGTGERALAVAEQLALEQVLGDGAAVEGDEWLVRVGTELMERPCDQLFSGSGLASHQNRDRQRRNPGDGIVNLDECRIVADDQRFRPELDLGDPIGRSVQGCPDSFDQGIDLEWFCEVVEDAETSGRGGSLDGPMGSHENDLRLGARFVAMFEQFEAGPVSEIDIGDDEIEIRRVYGLPCLIR